jgi:hypothetical protein
MSLRYGLLQGFVRRVACRGNRIQRRVGGIPAAAGLE